MTTLLLGSLARMRDFHQLVIWRRSHRLAVDVHLELASWRGPAAGAFRGQLQRAVASIPANIAEGCGKRSETDFARYLDIALGSAKEVENHLLFARDMGWIDRRRSEEMITELVAVRRMTSAFARAVRTRSTMSST